jgi:ribosomal protein S12 methylthiotransferase
LENKGQFGYNEDMKETVCMVSLGCPKNLVDSEVMLGLLSQEGYALTTDPSKAEILIVNTCSFIRDASQEAIDTVLQMARYKKEGRCRRLIVSGCLPQRYGKVLETELPEADLFIGTGSFQNLPRILAGKSRGKSYLSPSTFLYNEKTPRILSTPSFTAYLKIAEGCSKRCTFCTVPKIRGPYRSRRRSSVLKEAHRLADRGVKELILIAQDTTAYGEDLLDGASLEKLLKALAGVQGLRWIRMLYAYPETRYFTEGLLETMAQEEKICPYLDIPIQHIDDAILRRMGRRSKSLEIRAILQKIRAFVPEISLRSSLIVGFPGEGEAEFNSLLQFVEETQFDHLGVFKFSREEGTPASRLPNQVPEEVKEERLGIIMERQREISLRKHQKMIGKSVEVLVEGLDLKTKTLKGRLKTQAPEIDGCVFLKGEANPGDLVTARIKQAYPYDLKGEIERPRKGKAAWRIV